MALLKLLLPRPGTAAARGRSLFGVLVVVAALAALAVGTALGALVGAALIEVIRNSLGLLGINAFDQWGVELGKQLALQIAPAVEGDAAALDAQDASTQALIAYYQEHRK